MVSNAHVYQLTVSINFVTKRKKKDKEAFEINKKKKTFPGAVVWPAVNTHGNMKYICTSLSGVLH